MQVSIITFGCASNQADSDFMRSLLLEEGIAISEDPSEAGIIIVNSCTVKHHAESKFWKTVRELKLKGKRVIAAGCVPQADKQAEIKLKKSGISIIGVKDTDSICEAVKAESEGKHIVKNNSKKKNPYKKPITLSGITGKIQINEGCIGSCSYCKTKSARGDLISYPIKNLVTQAQCFIRQGAKELWLTSQDTGAYGRDIGTSLANLVKEIMIIQGDFFVRIGMSNPNTIKPLVKDIIRLMKKNERIYRFLHIPIQSANNQVLKGMNRKYDAKTLEEIFREISSSGLGITVSTDVICGFPNETEKQFLDTLDFIRKIKPDVLNISRYWARPGTKAASMKQPFNKVGINRTRKIKEEFDRISKEKNKAWAGWKGKALVTEKGKHGTYICRNKHYKQVILKSDERLGEFIEVEIERPRKFDFFGKALNRNV
ncbi:MAG TPA: tRNA (N(6)-L-threonylcarbamoyladenosine(37)-C(2))-methylthiotransferase [Candidatus Woesearchaeota archaeon]|nr:tRNA (N(6)-L-threonylcarbamoyladenosine(37)-C(2))-methylthiotransferase [Candidatus Woesearchaeota archaeon]